MLCLKASVRHTAHVIARLLHTSGKSFASQNYQLVVVGGGAGGCSTAAKFAARLGKGKVAVIEPSKTHYYQPLWTLVGGNLKTLSQSAKPMASVLPSNATWIQQRVEEFKPEKNCVITSDGSSIQYEYLVVAIGIQLNYDKVKGLTDALETPGVGSNYSPAYVEKTAKALREFKDGTAIFTFPNTPIKCAGAPQKIAYLADDYLRKQGKRTGAEIIYNTSLGVIFGVKKYADALWDVVKQRNMHVNLRHNLVEVKPDSCEAVFELLDSPGKYTTFKYSMLHATPPMSAPDCLRKCKELTDAAGYLDVNRLTLQHTKFPNIYGIGDCTNAPTSKTAAAVAAQVGVLATNLQKSMSGEKATSHYDGYTSCPLVTSSSQCILAEFDYDLQPLETFPFNQAKERRSMYVLKSNFMPELYWNMLLRGYWNGPKPVRKLLHFGAGK